jgi:phosphate transport system substrate-binding protein
MNAARVPRRVGVGMTCLAALAVLFAAGCTFKEAGPSADGRESGSGAAGGGKLSGPISIDGSSTVYPITQAVAEEFMKQHPRVSISVGIAGTGGGFKRFIVGDLDICDASRPIEPKELETSRQHGIEPLELKVGIDGLTVVVHPKNDWCDALTVEQLNKLWVSGSTIKKWKQLDPSYPDREILLYGPDTDSGTFDYFTEVICGRKGNSRSDYTPSSNDNVLIQGVQGDPGALGYFGYSYYALNQKSLKAVKIAPDAGKSAAVAPTDATILDGTYKPLSRPLFLYVNPKALQRPEVAALLRYYLREGRQFVSEVHYIPLHPDQQAESVRLLEAALKSPKP